MSRASRIFLSLTVFSSLALAAPPPLLPPGEAAVPGGPPFEGSVERYLLSPHGEVDGLLLKDGTNVKFPPHLGEQLRARVSIGDIVTVTPQSIGPTVLNARAVRAYSIKSKRSAQALVDQPPTTPPLPPDERGISRAALSASGTVSHVLVNERGQMDGLLLSSGEEVKFPPHLGNRVQAAFNQSPKAKVSVEGLGLRTDNGTVIEAETLSFNDKPVWAAADLPRRPPEPRLGE